MTIQRVAILGVGLIGGSLGLAWQARRPDLTLVGYDPASAHRALALGVLDAVAEDPAHAVAEADLVVLAAPIAANLRLLEAIAPHLRPGVVVTDVGSVKGPVMAHAASVLAPANPFVGGHPMAGAEHGGVEHAHAFLFENASYVVCPPTGTDPDAVPEDFAPLLALVEATGARVLVLEADRHDRIASAVSHLPQLLAVTLTNFVAEHNAEDAFFLRLAAGGFRDLTRIAASPFGIWRDILTANQGAVLDALGGFAAHLQRIRNRLIEEDLDALENTFDAARAIRETLPHDTKGFLHPLIDLFVYVEDEPGALMKITRLLFDAGLSIKDMELLKIREGTGGTFRLAFATDAEADGAIVTLNAGGFDAFRL